MCLQEKRTKLIMWLFVCLIGAWGIDGVVTVASGTDDARQDEKIEQLEKVTVEIQKTNYAILKTLNKIAVGVGQIQTKIQIYHGENGR